jgi:hypothetical protein
MNPNEIYGKENVHMEGTNDTPEIELNKREGFIKFSGRSLPENPKNFYEPIKDWLNFYLENPPKTTHVVFAFDYFNTASSKMIMEIIDLVKNVEKKNSELTIDWHYQEDDEDMLEAGEDFAEVTMTTIYFHPYP